MQDWFYRNHAFVSKFNKNSTISPLHLKLQWTSIGCLFTYRFQMESTNKHLFVHSNTFMTSCLLLLYIFVMLIVLLQVLTSFVNISTILEAVFKILGPLISILFRWNTIWWFHTMIPNTALRTKQTDSSKYVIPLMSYNRETIYSIFPIFRKTRFSLVEWVFYQDQSNITKMKITWIGCFGIEFKQNFNRKKHFQFYPNFPIFRITFQLLLL